MEIEVNELEPCKLKINYFASPEEIQNKKNEILTVFRKAPIPGFRKGKATDAAIISHYRNQFDESLKKALVEDAFHNVIFEKKLKPLASPFFENLFLADGKFNCTFTLFVKPDFNLEKFIGLEIKKINLPDDFNENVIISKTIDDLKIKFGTSKPFDQNDTLQNGDTAVISYFAKYENENIPELTSDGDSVVIGNIGVKGLDTNLIGMTVNEIKTFDFIAPDTSKPQLIGKNITFTVTLKEAYKVTPCEFDDDLALKCGKSNSKELEEFITQLATIEVVSKSKMMLAESVSKKLLEINNFNVPEWLVLSEAKTLASKNRLSWDTLTDDKKTQYISSATDSVKLALILDKIRETDADAQISDQEVFSLIKDNLSKINITNNTDDLINKLNQNGELQLLITRVRDEHALNFVISKTVFVE